MGIYHIRGYSGIWFLLKLCFRLETSCSLPSLCTIFCTFYATFIIFHLIWPKQIKNENLCEHEKHEYVWQKSIWYEETLLSKGNRVLITIRAIQHLFLSCVCTYVFENDKGKTIFQQHFHHHFQTWCNISFENEIPLWKLFSNYFFICVF